jgi:ADP-ribosyl-[dinitrogen reductase] hydrolase
MAQQLLAQIKRATLKVPADAAVGASNSRLVGYSLIRSGIEALVSPPPAAHYDPERRYQDVLAASRDVVEVGLRESRVDRAVGCLVGLALGDSVGAPLEFIPAVGEPLTPDTDRPHVLPRLVQGNPGEPAALHYHDPFNKFELLQGQWTDDSSMALCLADSLIANDGVYNGSDCRVRYFLWWTCGYNNAFRFDVRRPQGQTSVGLGGNIAGSLYAIEKYRGQPATQVPAEFKADGEDAGNGSIMRLAPVPILHWQDAAQAARTGIASSFATHPGTDAAACCAFLAYATSLAIKHERTAGTTAQSWLDHAVDDFLASGVARWATVAASEGKLLALLKSTPPSGKEACWDWRAETLPIEDSIRARGRRYNGYPVSPGYFGSYCMDGLAMALWAFRGSASFADCIIRVVNLLGDCDTTGAIAGQLAGAFYGYRAIPAPTPTEAAHRQPTRQHEDPVHSKPTVAATIGRVMLDNLQIWDPMSEIPLRAILLHELGRAAPADASATVSSAE